MQLKNTNSGSEPISIYPDQIERMIKNMAEKNIRFDDEPIDEINDDEFEESEKKINVSELIAKGKSKGSLTSSEIVEAIGDDDYDIDQIDKLYEDLENNGIEVNLSLIHI